jgi:hypothetical protein
VKRWATARRLRGASTPEVVAATTAVRWQAPSSRRCARWLTTATEKLDANERRFIEHLGQTAPGLVQAAVLANAFTKMVRDQHDTGFEAWLKAARASESRSFADGIDRDAAAVRDALTEPWSTSPVEGHINRVKTISILPACPRTFFLSGLPFLKHILEISFAHVETIMTYNQNILSSTVFLRLLIQDIQQSSNTISADESEWRFRRHRLDHRTRHDSED